jgi:alkaline phosphatase
MKHRNTLLATTIAAVLAVTTTGVNAAPTVTRLTPPSQFFATGGTQSAPMIARFIQGQRFDLQATVKPDAGQDITNVEWFVDGKKFTPVAGTTSKVAATVTAAVGSYVVSARGYSNSYAKIHKFTVTATQTDGAKVSATGEFEIVSTGLAGASSAKNVILMVGDGMGASQRTAARIMLNGYSQGKVNKKLAMDTFTNTAMIMTASLNSIVTDSAPGMQNYATGNKSINNQEGVWPDDTTDKFDNPRFEYLSEFLARQKGKKLGIVTTADVFDATPASNAVHTQDRGAGTGIADQYLDDASHTGLTVLMGGGRKWFLPAGTTGSARASSSDYTLASDITTGWGVAAGAIDTTRDLIADFQTAGWNYAADKTAMDAAGVPAKLLGLFSFSNMNVALDKIDGRRGNPAIVNDYGFTDQPMLDEMTAKAIEVLDANSPNGFVLMVEGASIDKQAHNMDSERMMLDTIELDRSIQKAKDYVDGKGDFLGNPHPDTLVIVTADHECAGAVIIGASTVSDSALSGKTNTAASMRDAVVGNYELAGFPQYTIDADGYPTTTNVDKRLLIGYGANADRYEDWRTNTQPLRDSQQPLNGLAPLNTYPSNPLARDAATGYLITGQVPGTSAVHTGGDIPLSAYGRGAKLFGGTIDNTDVFFSIMKSVGR